MKYEFPLSCLELALQLLILFEPAFDSGWWERQQQGEKCNPRSYSKVQRYQDADQGAGNLIAHGNLKNIGRKRKRGPILRSKAETWVPRTLPA